VINCGWWHRDSYDVSQRNGVDTGAQQTAAGRTDPVYCGPVLRHAAEPTQAANCRSSTAS
jgi:hypothetical protein